MFMCGFVIRSHTMLKIFNMARLTVFLILAGIIQVFAVDSYSQSTKLTLNFKDTKLEKVLGTIEDESEFFFLYNKDLIDVEQKVDIDAVDKKITEILDLLLEGKNIKYFLFDRQIVLSNQFGETGIYGHNTIAYNQQQRVVSGKITDSTGQPLPGVSIVIKGTTQGTVTDANGNYSLSNLSADATLVFSFVGMRTQEIAVGNRTSIDISMEEETIGIEEVVAVGYGTQKKINLTGAVSYTDSEVLESRPISNIAQGLQGVIPNLNISQASGSLGRSASFNIRGYTSINGGSPLVLINGVPGDINMLNPNDIQEVSVLKDAASSAIYGARGAFGVILITTKKGSGQEPNVKLSMNYSVNKPTVFNDIMDSKERLEYYNIATIRQSGTPYFDEIRAAGILAHYNDPSQPWLIPHPTQAEGYMFGAANINWPRELMRVSFPMQQYNASISGGANKITYYSSFSYLNEEGLAKGFDEQYNRYNITTEISYEIAKWATISSNILINKSDKHYPPNPTTEAFGEDVNYMFTNSWTEDPVYDLEGRYYTKDGKINMVQFLKEGGYRNRDIDDVWLTGRLLINPTKSISINIDYTHNNQDTEEEDYLKSLTAYNGQPIAIYQTVPNRVLKNNRNYIYQVFNSYANYENSFNLHNIKTMIGFNQERAIITNFEAFREQLIVQELPFMSLAYGNRGTEDGKSTFAIRGGFARLNYNFDERYLLEINGRYDGTSKFPKEDRFALFPSVSVGWRLDKEKFFSGLKNIFDVLKLRASYGSLGNQDVSGYYPYISTFSTGQVEYLIGNDKPMTAYAPGLISPTLTWEVVTQRNFGIDFVIFSGSLSSSLDIFRRDTKDMLTASEPLPSVLAVSEPRTNAADLKTTGFDLSIDWKQKIRNGNVGVSLSLSDYTSEITKYSNPTGLISSHYVGKKIGTIWGLVTGGIFQTDEEAQALDQKQISGRARQAGDLWFVDLDGDGKITRGKSTLDDPGDQKIIGNDTPRYSFGFRPNLNWKGFDLTVFLQGVMKRDVILSSTDFLYQYSSQWNSQPKIGTDYWREDNRDAYFPAPLITNSADVTTAQTRFMQNAAYLRLKELTLGYTLPMVMTSRMGIDRVRLYFSGYNLGEITDMIKCTDPELTNGRLYPLHRSMSLGLNIDF